MTPPHSGMIAASCQAGCLLRSRTDFATACERVSTLRLRFMGRSLAQESGTP
jgi:hypothetical protein